MFTLLVEPQEGSRSARRSPLQGDHLLLQLAYSLRLLGELRVVATVMSGKYADPAAHRQSGLGASVRRQSRANAFEGPAGGVGSLHYFRGLTRLDLAGTLIERVEGLEVCAQLRVLHLHNCPNLRRDDLFRQIESACMEHLAELSCASRLGKAAVANAALRLIASE